MSRWGPRNDVGLRSPLSVQAEVYEMALQEKDARIAELEEALSTLITSGLASSIHHGSVVLSKKQIDKAYEVLKKS